MHQLARLLRFSEGRARWVFCLKLRVLGRLFSLGRNSEKLVLIASKDSEAASQIEVTVMSLLGFGHVLPCSNACLKHSWSLHLGRSVPWSSSVHISCYFVFFLMQVCNQCGTMLVSNFSYLLGIIINMKYLEMSTKCSQAAFNRQWKDLGAMQTSV